MSDKVQRFKSMSIAEGLADREAMQSFALATGFPMIEMDIERDARRARWTRRKAGSGKAGSRKVAR